MKTRQHIVLVKYGSFSHVNERVAALLRECFPQYELRVVDAARDILANFPFRSVLLRLRSNLRHPIAFVRGRHSPWDFVFRDARAWDLISRWMRENIHPEHTAFVLQTQSMFDAFRPDIPFFIYTDHTREAHRRQIGGGAPAPASAAWRTKERALYRRADTVFTLSEFCARSVIEDYGVPAERVLNVSTGINMDLPGADGLKVEREPVILFVGGHWQIKGGPQLLDAFRLVRERMPEARLWLVGAAPREPGPGVDVFGRVDRGVLDRLYRRAAVVCVPSLLDRASMVALDAAAYGLPVVTNPSGAGAERVVEGVTGLVIDPRDVTALAAALLQLLRDPESARKMGWAGRERVERYFTWESVGRQMAERINKLLPS